MEKLDIFSKNNLELLQKSSRFKTRVGAIFTIIQIIASIIVIVLLNSRKYENITSSYNTDIISFRMPTIPYLIKFPKIYADHLHWIDYSPLRISNEFKICNNDEYFNFYNNTEKDDSMIYYCKNFNKISTRIESFLISVNK